MVSACFPGSCLVDPLIKPVRGRRFRREALYRNRGREGSICLPGSVMCNCNIVVHTTTNRRIFRLAIEACCQRWPLLALSKPKATVPVQTETKSISDRRNRPGQSLIYLRIGCIDDLNESVRQKGSAEELVSVVIACSGDTSDQNQDVGFGIVRCGASPRDRVWHDDEGSRLADPRSQYPPDSER